VALPPGAEEVRHRRQRQGNQDRQHHARIRARRRPTAPSARRSAAYFAKVNAEGGINGRKINFISLDDGYNPAKTVEQARKLVEEEEVLFVFNTAGHAAQQRDPQVHEPEEGAAAVRGHRRHQVGRPEELPLDHGLAAQLPERVQGLRAHILETKPNAKIASSTRTTTTARTT
jgi:branched-chain amino acid transport system substrate-binding protein